MAPAPPGTSFVARQASTWATNGLGDRFDLVGFDPRGTGASQPRIQCLTDAENDEERTKVFADPSPAGIAAAEADSRQSAERCTQRTGADVLANVGTRDVAKDMDVMRAAVGDQKMTYAGFSYGTELGTAYAEAFPQNVRALLLDGAIDPTQSTIDSTVKQNAGFQLAFDNFAKDCTSRPGCPLGIDPAKATQAFQTIMRPLIDRPARVGDGRILSFSDAQTGVSQALYVSQLWPALQQDLAGRERQRRPADAPGRPLLRARRAGPLLQHAAGLPGDQLCQPAGDHGAVGGTGAGEAGRRGRPVPLHRPRPGRRPRRVCVLAGPAHQRAAHAEGRRLPPVVVVSVTGDPATPYQAGVDLAQQLNGSLIKVNGNQHTASLQGDACTDKLAIDYLVNLTLPPQGAECTLAAS